MYSGLTKCHENVERLDPVTQCAHVVEPIVQKRLMGKLKLPVDVMMHDGAWLFGSLHICLWRFLDAIERTC